MRKQAQMTMRCMQALVRVQARVRARRLQLVQNKYQSRMEEAEEDDDDEERLMRLEEEALKQRTSSRKKNEVGSWDSRSMSIDKIKENSLRKHDAEIKRKRALAYAFAYQVW